MKLPITFDSNDSCILASRRCFDMIKQMETRVQLQKLGTIKWQRNKCILCESGRRSVTQGWKMKTTSLFNNFPIQVGKRSKRSDQPAASQRLKHSGLKFLASMSG
mmetsp:Transcript_31319/g.67377  ORF Transcript_31319/g.67377 Transcript_31319/m.67377 type:complete len:105 (-) Transcript_31319:128-442(-)